MNETKTEREQFLEDVLITAVEGGINYWADVVRTKYAECSATIMDNCQETAEITGNITINRQVLELGIRRIVTGKISINKQIIGWVAAGSATNDASDVDADAADAIVQAGLFGELIYG